ncbi:MAG: hypothetical protein EBS65_14390 [Betaproteobacteria bacterium]|nr:hypothetical protein [Betaproteobacteria bacterium]
MSNQHVPYKGTGPALNDVIGGKRSRYVPDVPTMTESGMPAYDQTVSDLWYGVFAPAGTPKAIVDRLNAEIEKVMNTTTVKDRMNTQGFERLSMTPADFATFLRNDLAKWGKVVKAAGLRSE